VRDGGERRILGHRHSKEVDADVNHSDTESKRLLAVEALGVVDYCQCG